MELYRDLMGLIGHAIEAVGVFIIVAGALIATLRFAVARSTAPGERYRQFRQTLGRAILLSLEFLFAGDIIRTVVVAPTLENLLVLALIIVIRTFLSMTLQLEVEGRWPWQQVGQRPG